MAGKEIRCSAARSSHYCYFSQSTNHTYANEHENGAEDKNTPKDDV